MNLIHSLFLTIFLGVNQTMAQQMIYYQYHTKESLKIFCDNVKFIQDFLGRNILIENPSAYIEFNQSEIHEIDFLNSIVKHTNCQLLLDINNVFVSAENLILMLINI